MKEEKELEKMWEQYDGTCYKKQFFLEELTILSYEELCDGAVRFKIIHPVQFRKNDFTAITSHPLKTLRVANLPSWAIESVRETGFAFRYDAKIYVADKVLLKCFSDYFGVSKEAAEPSIWRVLLLAYLFEQEGFAYVTVKKREHINVLYALHKTKLDGIECNIKDITKFLINNYHAQICDISFTEIHFEVELNFPLIQKHGWMLSLTIRDSNIGRESMTFYSGWRKKEGLIYFDEKKIGHRSFTGMKEISSMILQMLEETEDSFCMHVDLDINMIRDALKEILGKFRTRRFAEYLINHSEDSSDDILCIAASYADEKMNDQLLIKFRRTLGQFVKEGFQNVENS